MEIRNPDLLRAAAKVAVTERRVGAAMIQRKVRVGFAAAAGLLDQLAALGIVGERDPEGWRHAIVTADEAQRILERAGIGDEAAARRLSQMVLEMPS
jgi:DNA segregation ATPase FtsK/SpoIIIE-like protein